MWQCAGFLSRSHVSSRLRQALEALPEQQRASAARLISCALCRISDLSNVSDVVALCELAKSALTSDKKVPPQS
jgi:hypothetical protein